MTDAIKCPLCGFVPPRPTDHGWGRKANLLFHLNDTHDVRCDYYMSGCGWLCPCGYHAHSLDEMFAHWLEADPEHWVMVALCRGE